MIPNSNEMHFFDPFDDLEIYHGDLPHWRQNNVVYFVTFRLADSLPQAKLKQLKEDRMAWIKMNQNKQKYQYSKEDWIQYNYLFHQRVETWLGAEYGSCILKNEEVLSILVNALKYFDQVRYTLDSYVIMPNHVHIIVQPFDKYSLTDITHTWKSFTANMINRQLKQSGQLWCHESYDHIIRNSESLTNIRKYILNNPVKARIQLLPEALKVSEVSL